MTFHGSQNQTNPVAGTASSRDALRRKLFSNAVETQTPQRCGLQLHLAWHWHHFLSSFFYRNGGVCSSPIANDKGGLSTTPVSLFYNRSAMGLILGGKLSTMLYATQYLKT